VGGNYSILFDETTPGDMVDEAGNVLGRHRGIIHYTIGQRRGVGVSSTGEPYYVLAINAEKNQVVLSTNKRLFCEGFTGKEAAIHDIRLAGTSFRALVKIRQAHTPSAATVTLDTSGVNVIFEEAQRAIAPGQSAVFYDSEGFVLGGCVIEEALPLADRNA
jgi:tRNA-specific 2-thiouridylase